MAATAPNAAARKEASGSALKSVDETGSVPYSVKQVFPSNEKLDNLPPWKRQLFAWSTSVAILAKIASLLTVFVWYQFLIRHPSGWVAWMVFWEPTYHKSLTWITDLYYLILAPPVKRPLLRLIGDEVPTVDVIITVCGEPVDIVVDTACAACLLDYPIHRYNVIVSDDAKDADLRSQILDLQKKYPNLHYFARIVPPGVHHGYKAGNLNAAVKYSRQLRDNGTTDYIGVLDVDMIPVKDWLRATLPRLIQQPNAALVSLIQNVYNNPVNDPLFSYCPPSILADLDRTGAVFCNGSGFVYKPAALAAIGGWPEGPSADDHLATIKLLGRGYETVFVDENLQYGLMTENLAGHISQRKKWTAGPVENAFRVKFSLFKDESCEKMTLKQRIPVFLSFFKRFLHGLIDLPCSLVLPMCLLSGQSLFGNMTLFEIRILIGLFITENFLTWAGLYVSSLPDGFSKTLRIADGAFWLIPWETLATVTEISNCWTGTKIAYKPAGVAQSEMNERDAASRAPLAQRLKFLFFDLGYVFHIFWLVFLLCGPALSLVRVSRSTATPLQAFFSERDTGFWHLAFQGALWPGIPWAMYANLLVPLFYMISPPTMPERRALMELDPKTQTWRPKAEHRGPSYDRRIWGLLVVPTLAFALQIAAFAVFC